MRLSRIAAVGILMGSALGASAGHDETPMPATTPQQALKAMTEGNTRFVAGTLQSPRHDQERRCETFTNGQHPMAAVLSCADSRAPVELVFDQGIGDLFVIRVAGNVADTDEVGSIEYSVGHLGTPLVVVLGHSKCGAVTAVAEKSPVHGCVGQLVDNIVPAVEKALKQNPSAKGASLIAAATRQNVWQSIEDLYARSELLRSQAKAGKIMVVGALYDLHSGAVEWMGSHPEESRLLTGAKAEAQPEVKPEAKPEAKPSDEHAKPAEHGTTSEPAKDTEAKDHATHSEPAPAMRKKDNYLALAGLLGGGIALSAVTIRLIHHKSS